MTEARRTGPQQLPPTPRPTTDDIEDAEFVEFFESEKTSPPQAPPVQRKRTGLKITMWVVTLVIGFLTFLWFAGAPAPPANEAEAQQRLAEWTREVTGNFHDAGLILVDGPGEAGSPCDLDNAGQVVLFGGLKGDNGAGPILHDAFKMSLGDQKTSIEGSFWFDDIARTINIYRTEMVDREGNLIRSLPDATIEVRPTGDGFLEFRGTKLHVCEMENAG